MSLHLGLHWSQILGRVKKALKLTNKASKWHLILKVLGAVIALYGLYALIKHDLLSYMFLKNQFVFFDLDASLFLFFLDYLAMMGLWIWAATYTKALLAKIKAKGKRKEQ